MKSWVVKVCNPGLAPFWLGSFNAVSRARGTWPRSLTTRGRNDRQVHQEGPRGQVGSVHRPDEYRGYFEHDVHGEGGGLWFTNGELTDYDGVYFLPKDVATAIRSLGYTVPEDCLL